MKFGDPKSIAAAKRAIDEAERAEELEREGKNFYCTVYYTLMEDYSEDIVITGLEDEDIEYEASERFYETCGYSQDEVEVQEVTINCTTPVSAGLDRDTRTLEMFPESKDE